MNSTSRGFSLGDKKENVHVILCHREATEKPHVRSGSPFPDPQDGHF